MKKVTKLLSLLYSFLIFGTVLNINCRWPWEEKSHEEKILMYGPIENEDFGDDEDDTRRFSISNEGGDNKHSIILTTRGLRNLNWEDFPKQFALVHGANRFLYLHKSHGSGFTRLIKKLDINGTIQKECDDLLEKKGKAFPKEVTWKTGLFSSVTFKKYMPTGSTWLTKSGDLVKENVSHIIHAVGPNCNKPEEKEQFEDFLRMTYSNIFATIIDHNNTNDIQNPIKAVACPSLSTGISRCELPKAATVAAETIFNIMQNIVKFNDKNGPTIFIMFVHDNAHFKAYKEAFEKEAHKNANQANQGIIIKSEKIK
jgi:O-acetyl-ADP-ribose deacetylase (regulator of RNase III)